MLGFCSGAVAGLVVITPGTRLRRRRPAPSSSASLAGVVPFFACTKLKAIFKYDDALDTFGVHGVGGTLGALVTGFLATPEVNANLNTNLAGDRRHDALARAAQGDRPHAGAVGGGTAVIAYAVKAVLGLRPTPEAEEPGLDDTDHGEAGYHPDEVGFTAATPSAAGCSRGRPRRQVGYLAKRSPR